MALQFNPRSEAINLTCDGDPDGLYSICTHTTRVLPMHEGTGLTNLVTLERGWSIIGDLYLCPSCTKLDHEQPTPLRWKLQPGDTLTEHLATKSCFVQLNTKAVVTEKKKR